MIDKIEIILTQQDVAKAIEHWLNDKIMKEPCTVAELRETRVNSASTWKILLNSQQVETEQQHEKP